MVIYPPNLDTPNQIYQGFKPRQYRRWGGLEYKISPVQSWRLIPNESYQLDVVVYENELRALIADKYLIAEDLDHLFFDRSLETLNLVKRGYKFWYHHPGNFLPRYKNYKRIDVDEAVSNVLPNPHFGWYWYFLDWNQFMLIKKWNEPGGDWQLCFPSFIERASP